MVIQVENLTKRYGAHVAVDQVSFSVEKGEIVSFLGPNGAGKTTTMRVLTGYISPTAGSAAIAGLDVFRDRIAAAELLGYLPENCPLYVDMTPEGMLEFFARARGMSRARFRERLAKVVELCGLGSVLGKKISKLSRGFRQRVALANSLLHEPEVLILDEPTDGLDPNQIRDVRSTLRKIGEEKTILFSTHVLQEVEAIATRVIMISEGRLVFDGTPGALAQEGGGKGMEGAFYALTRSDVE